MSITTAYTENLTDPPTGLDWWDPSTLVDEWQDGIDDLLDWSASHLDDVSTVANYVSMGAYALCGFGGVGCAVGAAFNMISATTQLAHTVLNCSGLSDAESCRASVEASAISAGGIVAPALLAHRMQPALTRQAAEALSNFLYDIIIWFPLTQLVCS